MERWSQRSTTIKAVARLAQARSKSPRAGRGRADRGRPPHVVLERVDVGGSPMRAIGGAYDRTGCARMETLL